ncbi:MAG: heat-inducible transcriptional repressor HrcA [Lachnospiraceae bacterium]|nr:heat-inducible transcriptional repressor HrcA [Lachnospiraceae bacterium]
MGGGTVCTDVSTLTSRVLTKISRREEAALTLDDRKKKILLAIIKTYLDTGEPVGSRTISKIEGLDLSSATIRNEMADLVEMGYILQPHTSAGRIPSDKGYRFYVDQLMSEKEQQLEERERETDEMKDMLVEKADKMERLLKQVARSLSVNTNYAAMISAPRYNINRLKFIQLSRMEANRIVAVIVVEGNMIKNQIIDIEEPIDDETLLKLNMLLNTTLNGMAIEDINLSIISKMKQQAGEQAGIISEVIDAVAESIKADEDLEIYTSGANNIFKYPELADNERASEIITAFEEKKQLTDIVYETLSHSDEKGIQVYIGEESPVENMKDCSVVTATYELGEGIHGTIGIIGPKRMDYDKVLSTMKKLSNELDSIFKKT